MAIDRSCYRLAIIRSEFNICICQGDSTVKKTTLGLAAALVLGFAAFAAPASAAPVAIPAPGFTGIAHPGVTKAYVERRVIRRGPRCTVRKIVRRGPYGRRVVTTKRVCY